jgi:hypothetical protein
MLTRMQVRWRYLVNMVMTYLAPKRGFTNWVAVTFSKSTQLHAVRISLCWMSDHFLPVQTTQSFRGATMLSDSLTGLYASAGPLCEYCILCPRLITRDDNRKGAWLTQCCKARCGVSYSTYRVPSNSTVYSQHVSSREGGGFRGAGAMCPAPCPIVPRYNINGLHNKHLYSESLGFWLCPSSGIANTRKGNVSRTELVSVFSQSHFTADSQSVLVSSPLCGRLTRYCFLFKSLGLEFVVLPLWGALSDERPSLTFVSHSLVICLCVHLPFTFFFHTFTIYIYIYIHYTIHIIYI